MAVTEGTKLYSDRFKQRTDEAKPTVSAASLSDFPSLKKNTVVTAAPTPAKAAWAQTVKTAIVQEEAAKEAAKARALVEAERQKKEAIRSQSYMPSRMVASSDAKGYEQDYREEYEDYQEEALGGGTPPYGNRGFDDEEEENGTW